MSSVVRTVRPSACRPSRVLSPCLPGFLRGTAALAAEVFGLEPVSLEHPLLSPHLHVGLALFRCHDRLGPDRPYVWQVIRDVWEQRPVMILFFAHERRLVAAVYRLIPEPRGQRIGGGKFWLRANNVEARGA